MKKMWSCAQISRQATKLAVFTVLALGVVAPLHAASPQWLRDAAQAKLPAYDPETKAVVLLDEKITTVLDSGEVKTTYRVAKKILNAHGREEAKVVIRFDSETKVSNIRAWSIPPSGQEYELKEKDALEFTAFDYELYSDERYKLIQLPSDPGNIIGYEYEQKERPRVFSERWSYQEDIPVVTSRFTLNLPPSWEMETFWVNRDKAEPVRSGNSYTWQEQNVPAVKREDSMPSWGAVVPRMYVAFFSSGAARSGRQASWDDVGGFLYSLVSAQRQPTPAIQTMAAKLVAGQTTFLDKVKAISRFAQRDVRYVAIEIGIGGFQPHSAESILANRYGDCKDKSTVMGAMLKAVGINSYALRVNTERGVIFPQAPTPWMFDHEIIAVEVPRGETLPPNIQSIVSSTKFGTLLIFDPTDEATPLGQLPPHLPASHGLLLTEKGSDLIPLPKPEPQANELARTAKLSLSPDGVLSGKVTEVRRGAEAWYKRHQLRKLAIGDRRKAFENSLSPFLTAFTLKDFSIENLDDNDKELVLSYSFEAPSYSKKMGPLFLVRPRVFGSKAENIDFNKKERKYPFALDAVSHQTDDFEITLPTGFTVDELPPPTLVKDGPLEYQSATAFSGQTLTYKRTYNVGDVLFPAEKRADLQRFFGKVQQDETSAAVLKRVQ